MLGHLGKGLLAGAAALIATPALACDGGCLTWPGGPPVHGRAASVGAYEERSGGGWSAYSGYSRSVDVVQEQGEAYAPPPGGFEIWNRETGYIDPRALPPTPPRGGRFEGEARAYREDGYVQDGRAGFPPCPQAQGETVLKCVYRPYYQEVHLSDGFFAGGGGVGPDYIAGGGGGGGFAVVSGGGRAGASVSISASARASVSVSGRGGGGGGGKHGGKGGCGCH